MEKTKSYKNKENYNIQIKMAEYTIVLKSKPF